MKPNIARLGVDLRREIQDNVERHCGIKEYTS